MSRSGRSERFIGFPFRRGSIEFPKNESLRCLFQRLVRAPANVLFAAMQESVYKYPTAELRIAATSWQTEKAAADSNHGRELHAMRVCQEFFGFGIPPPSTG